MFLAEREPKLIVAELPKRLRTSRPLFLAYINIFFCCPPEAVIEIQSND